MVNITKLMLSPKSTMAGLWVVDAVSDYIIDVFKSLMLKCCTGVGHICIIVCGMSIMWYIIDNNNRKAKGGFSGSIIVYIGTKLIEVCFK